MKKTLLICILAVFGLSLFGQDSIINYEKRKKILTYGATAAYAGSMTLLYQAWYKNYKQSPFHFYNDNDNWMLADKMGHTFTSYQISRLGHGASKWAGYPENTSVWVGGATGFVFQTVIEVLDGFSAGWGASPGDLAANTLGSALFISQQKLWQQQRITIKLSYHHTKFNNYRPDLLGSNEIESILKDYNGLTIWLSGNLKSFWPESALPDWLNMAVGYNAYGMTGASSNSMSYNGNPIPEFDRTRRFLLSPDIDWTNIESDSRFVTMLLKGLSFIKLPAPALEWNQKNGLRVHLVYF